MQFFTNFLNLAILGGILATTTACASTQPTSAPSQPSAPSPPIVVAAATTETEDFFIWVEQYKKWAENQGIRRDILDMAFADIKAPRQGSLEADAKQPEFTLSFSDYYYRTVSQERLQRAQNLYRQHRDLLNRVYEKYGVPPEYLLAFWGLESNFGDYTGKVPVIHTLATLAYDKRRRQFFEKQLLHALRIIQAGDIAPQDMQGSWAGAMGQTQFMPTTFTGYAVDGDGDGRRDLWNSLPDVFYSSANFLNSIGWRQGEAWGYQVALPADFDYSLSGRQLQRPVSYWQMRGVRLINGEPLPAVTGNGSVIVPAGHSGEAFLILENFKVIMRWNHSVLYALSVGLLAQQIEAGAESPIIIAKSPPLATATVKRMQAKLNALGYGAGGADGVLGSRTKGALRKFQEAQGLPADGYPTEATLRALQL